MFTTTIHTTATMKSGNGRWLQINVKIGIMKRRSEIKLCFMEYMGSGDSLAESDHNARNIIIALPCKWFGCQSFRYCLGVLYWFHEINDFLILHYLYSETGVYFQKLLFTYIFQKRCRNYTCHLEFIKMKKRINGSVHCNGIWT